MEEGRWQILSSSLALIAPADFTDSVRAGKENCSTSCDGGKSDLGIAGAADCGAEFIAVAADVVSSFALLVCMRQDPSQRSIDSKFMTHTLTFIMSISSGEPGVGTFPSLIAFKIVAALYLQYRRFS